MLQFYKKSVTWGLIASLLNLLLLVASADTIMANPLETGQPDHSQSQNTDTVPCHNDMVSAPDQGESACDQHLDNSCEYDCTSCVLAHIGVPVHARHFIQGSATYMEGIAIRLVSLSYNPNPPPPKHFS